ncbi:MAG: VOC family protein [Cohaesibacteraceae bacterium]|nr:VOC family protein [Cohaesibacteraceae bacterium]
MIGYVTLGTNDYDRAGKFYDALFSVIDVSRLWSSEGRAGWGPAHNQPSLCIVPAFDGKAASVGNGVMVALIMKSTDDVDAMHAKAMELGAKDEGKPGPRGEHGFYGGYFRDPDGNKLTAYVRGS